MPTIGRFGRLTIGSVQAVGQGTTHQPSGLHLGNVVAIGDGGEHDVGQCQGDLLAIARGAAVELGSYNPIGEFEFGRDFSAPSPAANFN